MTPIDVRRHYLASHFDESKAVHYLELIGFSHEYAVAYLHLCH